MDAGQMCWAADSEAIFLGFNTNQIGRLDVFDEDEGDDMPSASLTDGWDSPPSWALAPDGSLAVLVTRADHEDQAIAIVTLGDGDVEDDDCEWLDNTIPEGMVRVAEAEAEDDDDDDDEGEGDDEEVVRCPPSIRGRVSTARTRSVCWSITGTCCCVLTAARGGCCGAAGSASPWR